MSRIGMFFLAAWLGLLASIALASPPVPQPGAAFGAAETIGIRKRAEPRPAQPANPPVAAEVPADWLSQALADMPFNIPPAR
jgi:hypothetical protein